MTNAEKVSSLRRELRALGERERENEMSNRRQSVKDGMFKAITTRRHTIVTLLQSLT